MLKRFVYYVTYLSVIKYLVEIIVLMVRLKVISINQMSKSVHICHIHEDILKLK